MQYSSVREPSNIQFLDRYREMDGPNEVFHTFFLVFVLAKRACAFAPSPRIDWTLVPPPRLPSKRVSTPVPCHLDHHCRQPASYLHNTLCWRAYRHLDFRPLYGKWTTQMWPFILYSLSLSSSLGNAFVHSPPRAQAPSSWPPSPQLPLQEAIGNPAQPQILKRSLEVEKREIYERGKNQMTALILECVPSIHKSTPWQTLLTLILLNRNTHRNKGYK